MPNPRARTALLFDLLARQPAEHVPRSRTLARCALLALVAAAMAWAGWKYVQDSCGLQPTAEAIQCDS